VNKCDTIMVMQGMMRRLKNTFYVEKGPKRRTAILSPLSLSKTNTHTAYFIQIDPIWKILPKWIAYFLARRVERRVLEFSSASLALDSSAFFLPFFALGFSSTSSTFSSSETFRNSLILLH